MHFSFKGFIFNLLLVLSGSLSMSVLAQQPPPGAPAATPFPTPSPQEKPAKTDKNVTAKQQQFTAEQLAEAVVIIYGGRAFQTQVGKTTLEHGNLSVTNADGTVDNAKYEKRIIRGENIQKDKWRIDQKFPSVEFALVYNTKIFGLLNDSVFTPRQDAVSTFESQMYHGMDALLRFRENGSKVELGEKQKNLGVEYYTLDLIDKNERRTRYLISVKLLRVMSLEYTENSVKYVRRFSDYRYAQGLLVAYKSWLFANDKQIEETLISTVTFGQKVEESYFAES